MRTSSDLIRMVGGGFSRLFSLSREREPSGKGNIIVTETDTKVINDELVRGEKENGKQIQ